MIINYLKAHPFFSVMIGATFLTTSWPFIFYPFTDGDIGNWLWVARDMRETGQFLFGPNDQAHGPLLPWLSALFSAVAPTSFYPYALFNILISCCASGIMYIFSFKKTKNQPSKL